MLLSQASAAGTVDRLPGWKIVYDHYDARLGEGGAGIDVISSQARQPRALLRRPRGSKAYFYPQAWSPDGSHVAFDSPGGLHVVQSDGGGLRRLAPEDESGLIWAPDGGLIAFVVDCQRGYEAPCKRGTARIDLIAHDGTGRRTLVRPTVLGPDAQIRLEDWSPDGRQLLFVVSGRGGDRLYAVRSDGSRRRPLARSPEQGRLGGASWSPDGRLVAYKRRCEQARGEDIFCDLAVMNADGTSKRVRLRWSTPLHGPSDEAVTWLLHSSRIVVAEWGYDADTRVIDATTGGSRVISKEPWRSVTPASDGKAIGFLYNPSHDNLNLGLSRLDGTIVARRKLPFDSGASYDLWVG